MSDSMDDDDRQPASLWYQRYSGDLHHTVLNKDRTRLAQLLQEQDDEERAAEVENAEKEAEIAWLRANVQPVVEKLLSERAADAAELDLVMAEIHADYAAAGEDGPSEGGIQANSEVQQEYQLLYMGLKEQHRDLRTLYETVQAKEEQSRETIGSLESDLKVAEDEVARIQVTANKVAQYHVLSNEHKLLQANYDNLNEVFKTVRGDLQKEKEKNETDLIRGLHGEINQQGQEILRLRKALQDSRDEGRALENAQEAQIRLLRNEKRALEDAQEAETRLLRNEKHKLEDAHDAQLREAKRGAKHQLEAEKDKVVMKDRALATAREEIKELKAKADTLEKEARTASDWRRMYLESNRKVEPLEMEKASLRKEKNALEKEAADERGHHLYWKKKHHDVVGTATGEALDWKKRYTDLVEHAWEAKCKQAEEELQSLKDQDWENKCRAAEKQLQALRDAQWQAKCRTAEKQLQALRDAQWEAKYCTADEQVKIADKLVKKVYLDVLRVTRIILPDTPDHQKGNSVSADKLHELVRGIEVAVVETKQHLQPAFALASQSYGNQEDLQRQFERVSLAGSVKLTLGICTTVFSRRVRKMTSDNEDALAVASRKWASDLTLRESVHGLKERDSTMVGCEPATLNLDRNHRGVFQRTEGWKTNQGSLEFEIATGDSLHTKGDKIDHKKLFSRANTLAKALEASEEKVATLVQLLSARRR